MIKVFRSSAVIVLALAIGGGCRWGLTPKIDYRLRSINTLPITKSASDGSKAFAKRFCSTVRHLDPSGREWGPCTDWLETPVSDQPPETSPIPTTYGVIVVAGIFSQCFRDKGLNVFEQGLKHLAQDHGLKTAEVVVSGAGSSEANAAQIDKFLENNRGEYIAVGYSKGIADLMVALQDKPHARNQIAALVSVAGAVGGLRLADLPSQHAISWFERVVEDSGIGKCDIQDAGGLRSLTREERFRFLGTWNPPQALRSFSVVGVVPKAKTSKALHFLWERVNYYSLDEDSQVIAEEGIIPGARFLGVAKGDHWALALPFYELNDSKVRREVDQNRFPRTALLEAIVREVTQ